MVFCKIGVLKNFAKFTGKHLCQCLFFNKVASLRPFLYRTPPVAASIKYLTSMVIFFSETYLILCQTSIMELLSNNYHCVKSVRSRKFSGPYFPAFGLNTERYSLSLPIQYKCGKIRTTKTPNMHTFHVGYFCKKALHKCLTGS